MRFKFGLAVSLLVLAAGCKTTESTSESSAVAAAEAASVAKYNLGFERFPSYIPKNVVVLTFDDGVDTQYTPRVLDVLKEKGVKASFFINSNEGSDLNNPAMQNVLRRIVSEGHELANHTAGHKHLPELSAQEINQELLVVSNAVRQVVGKPLTLVRAPFGEPYQNEADSPGSQPTYAKVMSSVAQHGVHIGWNFDSDDWRFSSGAEVKANVQRLLDEGNYGIVLFHSTKPQTADSIAQIIDYMQKTKKMSFMQIESVLSARWGKTSAQIMAEAGSEPPPAIEPSKPVAQECGAPAWVAGKFYKVGSQVVYQNQIFTAINQDNPGYDPKISTWFWQAGAMCSSVVPSQPPVAKPVEPSPPVHKVCDAPGWQAGHWYEVGNQVVYQGQLFTAQNERNPGYDPKISTWFWKAGELCP